jgi:hypothetical protein
MTDEELIARLRVANAYKGPDFNTPIADPIKVAAADRIEALGRGRDEWKSLAEAAIKDDASKNIHYAEVQARNAKAVEALRFYSCDNSCDECPVSERGRVSCGWTARAVLAEIEGGKKDE